MCSTTRPKCIRPLARDRLPFDSRNLRALRERGAATIPGDSLRRWHSPSRDESSSERRDRRSHHRARTARHQGSAPTRFSFTRRSRTLAEVGAPRRRCSHRGAAFNKFKTYLWRAEPGVIPFIGVARVLESQRLHVPRSTYSGPTERSARADGPQSSSECYAPSSHDLHRFAAALRRAG